MPFFIFPKGAHFCNEQLADLTKFDLISLDWTQSISKVRSILSRDVALQGNLDPCILFAEDEVIISKTHKMLQQAGKTKYVANLGWGMLPEHTPEKLKVFVDAVHSFSLAEKSNSENH